MYLYNLNCENFKKMINNNNKVIVGVFEEKCVISNLFKGVLNKLNEMTDKKIIVTLIEKNEYLKIVNENEKQIFPTLLVYDKNEIIKKIDGLNNYYSIIIELKRIKFC